MSRVRFPLVAFGLVLLLALVLRLNYQREVETRQHFVERTQEAAIELSLIHI